MSAVQRREQLSLPVRVERRKRTSLLTARERVDLFGHLSAHEKHVLRLRVDAALRDKYRVPATGNIEEREKCCAITGPFGMDVYCQNFAQPGDLYCRIHKPVAEE